MDKPRGKGGKMPVEYLLTGSGQGGNGAAMEAVL